MNTHTQCHTYRLLLTHTHLWCNEELKVGCLHIFQGIRLMGSAQNGLLVFLPLYAHPAGIHSNLQQKGGA